MKCCSHRLFCSTDIERSETEKTHGLIFLSMGLASFVELFSLRSKRRFFQVELPPEIGDRLLPVIFEINSHKVARLKRIAHCPTEMCRTIHVQVSVNTI